MKSIVIISFHVDKQLYRQTMANGTTSALHGKTALDHGRCIKMERWQLLEKASIQVFFSPATRWAFDGEV